MSLTPGETETLRICVSIPLSLMAGIYQGAAYLEAAARRVYDDIGLNVFVECVPALDILDDEGAMSGNELVLAVALGTVTASARGAPSAPAHVRCRLPTGFRVEESDGTVHSPDN